MNMDWRMARVIKSGYATYLDLKERLTYEEFRKLDEICEVNYLNEVKVANYRRDHMNRKGR